jgi:OmcA/MtrC family decaheme c-type cytochrome
MTFTVKKGGDAAGNFTFNPSGYRYAASTTTPGLYPITADFTRTTAAPVVAATATNGTYTATWAGAAPTVPTTYMVSVYNAAAAPRQQASAVGYLNGNPRNVASNDGCIGCHSNNAFKSGSHHGANPQGVEACVVCHTRATSVSRGAGGDRTTAYVHGIHNSHNMPAGGYDRQFPVKDGVIDFEVTYPTYMTNCKVCHSTPEQLAVVNNAPVSYSLCFSCHDSWAGFGTPDGVLGGVNHSTFDWNSNCALCHDGSIARKTAKEFHNGLLTERSGLIWDGADVSVTEGAKVDMQITGITRTGNDLAVTWTALYDGTAVNPCNAVATIGAPAFHAAVANTVTGQAASNFSLLRAFGEGDDFTNNGIGTSPGQPLATNLSTTNTVCVGNTATTTITLTATEIATTAVKGVVALQGKAQVKLPFVYSGTTVDVDQVRSKTPTREFVVATGALPTTARRAIVDTAACLKCHVGSLYQHGGNRIDNVDMCILCHNEASSEQNVRTNDGVDASEAYDGQAGQTYGFKSLLHAVHSSGETGKITMVYRTNGIYVWAGEDTKDTIPNWPGTGSQTVYGSNPSGTNLVGTTRVHNLHVPTYPRSLNDCAACHKPNTTGLPNQSIATATTINAGGTPWGNGNDDTLEGASAAACMSCHQSGNRFEQAVLKSHAYQNGWIPSTFPAGRQTLLDAAK